MKKIRKCGEKIKDLEKLIGSLMLLHEISCRCVFSNVVLLQYLQKTENKKKTKN